MNYLAVDVGNTDIVYGIFRGNRLVKERRFPTFPLRLPKIKTKIDKVIVASVVPSINKKLARLIVSSFNLRPAFVTAENLPGLKVRLKNKRGIGADRVVDALAAYRLYGGPAIVVDFGTATTFDVVSAGGEYLGGAIAPGLVMARNFLYEKTAKLPKIRLESPQGVIGRNTLEAMRSGLIYGYVALVEGMIKRIKSSLVPHPSSLKVIATGGLAKLICKHTKIIDTIDQKLTLKGLRMIGEMACRKN